MKMELANEYRFELESVERRNDFDNKRELWRKKKFSAFFNIKIIIKKSYEFQSPWQLQTKQKEIKEENCKQVKQSLVGKTTSRKENCCNCPELYSGKIIQYENSISVD
jgi:hypothetical protein